MQCSPPISSTPSPRQKKNHYILPHSSSPSPIIISSSFDSGNIQLIRQINDYQFRLAAVPDDLKSTTKKCWFHFKVKAPKMGITMRFTIINVSSVLFNGYQNGVNPKCVFKQQHQQQQLDTNKQEWKIVPVIYMTHSEESQLIIEHVVKTEGFVYFALTVPFSCYDQIIYLENLDDRLRGREDVYYVREVLTKSTLGFGVHMLTITGKIKPNQTTINQQNQQEPQFQDRIHETLFPTDDSRPLRTSKPIIFINSRVHPGQTTSSHTLNGIIQFLISNDIRAFLLLKLFTFIIIPMANPDGVFQGNYRMDSTGTNLNRVYNLATPILYPQIFAIRKLIQYYSSDQRLHFYFDLHGHTSAKNSFIYGNALDNIVSQIESELYCRILDLNTKYFSWKDCCFSERHMSMRDKNQPLSKEGCSRVVIGKITGLINCFTVEIGIYGGVEEEGKEVGEVGERGFQWKGKRVEEEDEKVGESLVNMCKNLGKQMMVSLIDRIQKNPFTRLFTSPYKTLQLLRKHLAFQILNTQQRFKNLDIKAYNKVKFISKHYPQVFTNKINKKLSLIEEDEQLQGIPWPVSWVEYNNNSKAVKNKEKEGQLKQKGKNLSQSRLENPIGSRKLIKCMSQAQKLEQIPHINIGGNIVSSSISPSVSPNVQPNEPEQSRPFQFKITEIRIMQKQDQFYNNISEQLIRQKISKDKMSTRKLLKQFSNQRQKDKQKQRQRAQSDRIQDINKLRHASPINMFSKDDTIINDIKQRINSKIQLRKNNSVLRKGINSNRLRTDQLQEVEIHELKVEADKKGAILQKYSQVLSLPKDRVLAMTQPENPITDKEILERKIKKIRNFKREILNVKFSDIRKRGSLRLPEIRGVKGTGGKKEEFLNLQELRKDIQVVKLISATSSNLLRQHPN